MIHKKFKAPVNVVNGDTGEIVGRAVPAKIVGAHLRGNRTAYLEFQGKQVSCTFNVEHPDSIKIFPEDNPWTYTPKRD